MSLSLVFFPLAQTSPGCFTFHSKQYHNKSFIFVWNVVHVQLLCNPRQLQNCPAQPWRTSHRSSSPMRKVATSTRIHNFWSYDYSRFEIHLTCDTERADLTVMALILCSAVQTLHALSRNTILFFWTSWKIDQTYCEY